MLEIEPRHADDPIQLPRAFSGYAYFHVVLSAAICFLGADLGAAFQAGWWAGFQCIANRC